MCTSYKFCWRLVAGVLAWLAGWGAVAQPTVSPVRVWQYDHQRPGWSFRLEDAALVAPNQVAQIGLAAPRSATRSWAFLLLTNAHGDTIRSQTYPQLLPDVSEFFRLVVDPDSGMLMMSAWENHGSPGLGLALTYLDQSGAVRWNQYMAPPAGMTIDFAGGLALPDGFLLSFNWGQFSTSDSFGRLLKVDRRGRIKWQKLFNPNENPFLASPVRSPDGSFLLCQQSIYNASPPYTNFSADYWLTRYGPDGTLLQSAFAGRPRTKDEPHMIRPTPDGGAVLVGASTVLASIPINSLTYGKLIKVDSLLQTEWSVDIAPQWLGASADCWLMGVQPLANGHYWASGMTTIPGSNPPTTVKIIGVIAEIAPPAQAGDTTGQVLQQWLFPDVSSFRHALATASDTAYLLGITQRLASAGVPTYLAQVAGLGTPAVVDVCATPPTLPDLAVAWQPDAANPTHFAFSADSAQVTAGPRYAAVSLVRWEFGDGTLGYGWHPQHTYATSQPVSARVCVYNNLYCAACQTFFPLGPLGVAAERAAGVSVSPNPAPDGRYALRVSGPVLPLRLTVLDALGRVVRQQPVSGPDTALDLGAVAPGVYSLRLHWPDGGALTRRLVR